MQCLQMECERRRLKTDAFADNTRGKPFRTALYQQAVDRESVLMRESSEGLHHFAGLHGAKRYYDDTRNVNDARVTVRRVRSRIHPLPQKG